VGADAEEELIPFAEAVADGVEPRWPPAVEGPLATAISDLQIISEIARVHRVHQTSASDDDTQPQPAAPSPGSDAPMWAHLRLLEPLGSGSFGDVFRAWDTNLDREVALKLLRPSRDLSFDAALREGQRLARISHPNVVTVHGAQQLEGRVGIWGELLRGRTLNEIVERDGTMSALEATVCGEAICRALSAAHHSGVLHRDVKPQNVMRERGGRIVLMDFGLGIELADAPTKARLAGTPLYLAPELFEGQQPSVRSDIYSLGVLLFYLVTGSVPVPGRSLEEIKEKHRTGTRQRVQDLRADLPATFVRVLERAVAPKPEDRFESGGEFLAALGTASVGMTASSGIDSRRRPAWHVISAAAVIAGAGIAAGALFVKLRTTEPVRTPVVATIEPPPGARFAESIRNVAAVSPDGRHVAFVATEDGDSKLCIRSLASAAVHVIADSAGASNPFWSPASDAVAFFSRNGLRRVSVDGVRSERLAAPTEERGGSWNAKGVLLFAAGPRDGLFTVPATGGTPTRALMPDHSKGEMGFLWPKFLPDGERFVFFVWSNDERVRGIYQGRLGAREYTRLIGSDTSAETTEDYLLFVRDGTIVAQRFDPDGARVVGEPVSLLPQVTATPDFRSAVTASRTGVLIYTPFPAADLTNLVRFDRTGKRLDTIGTPGKYRNPAISRDGRYLAVQTYDDSLSEIRVFDLLRGSASRLPHAANAELPIWADDGRLAYAATDNGWKDVFVTRIDADAPAQLLYRSEEDKIPTDWSPDGRYLSFTSLKPGGDYDVFVVPVPATSQPISIAATTTAFEADGQFSPDGRQIAYISTISEQPEIYVKGFPFGSAARRVSTFGGTSLAWAADGMLYFMDLRSRLMRVRIPASGTEKIPEPTLVMQTEIITSGTSRTYFALAPDGGVLVNTPVSGSTNLAVVANWTSLLRKP
jgi:eukaryotic-like serine/threonine-protein kinase